MKIFVKVNENNKPWIESASTEELQGYTPILGLMDYQIMALLKFPDKCFLSDDGVLHAPSDLPISEQEKQQFNVQQLQEEVKTLNQTVDSLNSEKTNLQNTLQASQNINSVLLKKLNSLGQNVDALMQENKQEQGAEK